MIMVKYIVKRLLMVIPVVLGVMVIVFFFQSVSNDDPALQALGSGSTMEDREEWREEHGLNDPILIQFGRYVFNFVTKGDLGNSYESNQPVTGELLTRLSGYDPPGAGGCGRRYFAGHPIGRLVGSEAVYRAGQRDRHRVGGDGIHTEFLVCPDADLVVLGADAVVAADL